MDLRTRTRQLGAKEKARKKKCDVRFSFSRSNRVFRKNYMRIGVRKLLRSGFGPRESVGTSRCHCAYRKTEVEEVKGRQAGRQQRVCFLVTFHGVVLYGG